MTESQSCSTGSDWTDFCEKAHRDRGGGSDFSDESDKSDKSDKSDGSDG